MDPSCSINPSMGLQSANLPFRSQTCQPPQSWEPIPQNQSLSLSLTHTHTHTYTHTSYLHVYTHMLSVPFSGEPCLPHLKTEADTVAFLKCFMGISTTLVTVHLLPSWLKVWGLWAGMLKALGSQRPWWALTAQPHASTEHQLDGQCMAHILNILITYLLWSNCEDWSTHF